MSEWIPMSSRQFPDTEEVVPITYIDNDGQIRCDLCAYVSSDGIWHSTNNGELNVVVTAWYKHDVAYNDTVEVLDLKNNIKARFELSAMLKDGSINRTEFDHERMFLNYQLKALEITEFIPEWIFDQIMEL